MIDTKTIRTQQEIIAKRNMALPKKWILGIDAGFSSLKGFAPNKYFCFPSFAHKLDSELQVVNEKDILYRDESGTYLVGASAQNQIGSDDTNETETELYARNRYANKKFKIVIATGMALGISENLYGKKSDEHQGKCPGKWQAENHNRDRRQKACPQAKTETASGKSERL